MTLFPLVAANDSPIAKAGRSRATYRFMSSPSQTKPRRCRVFLRRGVPLSPFLYPSAIHLFALLISRVQTWRAPALTAELRWGTRELRTQELSFEFHKEKPR